MNKQWEQQFDMVNKHTYICAEANILKPFDHHHLVQYENCRTKRHFNCHSVVAPNDCLCGSIHHLPSTSANMLSSLQ